MLSFITLVTWETAGELLSACWTIILPPSTASQHSGNDTVPLKNRIGWTIFYTWNAECLLEKNWTGISRKKWRMLKNGRHVAHKWRAWHAHHQGNITSYWYQPHGISWSRLNQRPRSYAKKTDRHTHTNTLQNSGRFKPRSRTNIPTD